MSVSVLPSADDRLAHYEAHDKASKVKAAIDSSRKSVKRLARGTAERVSRVLSGGTIENIEQLKSNNEPKDQLFIKKTRWQIAIMANIGFLIAFGIRCNFGAAKTRMITNFTDLNGVTHPKEFHWTASQLGLLESSFFYGYAASQIPGGLLAAKFAPNILFGLSVSIASLINIAIPIALYYHPSTDGVVVALQIAQGLSLGIAYPCMHGVWRYFAPPLERSKLVTTTFTGAYLGVMIGLPLSAILVSYISWSAPFYFYGIFGCVWFIGWVYISAPSPKVHPRINEAEKEYIINSIGPVASSGQVTLTTVPWKEIFLSGPNWAITISNFCRGWVFFLLIGNQLTYMKDVLKMDIHNGGLFAALPQLSLSIVVLFGGQASDYLRSTGKMSTTAVRKLFNTIGFCCEASLLCMLAFVKNPVIAIIILTLSCGLSGFTLSGFNVNHFDIAPRYAPILMGISNGVGALAGLGNIVTEHLTAHDPAGWKECFLVAMGIDLFAAVTFLIFGSGELQDWAKEEEPTQTMSEIIRRVSTAVRRMSTVSRKGTPGGRRMGIQKLREQNGGVDGISNFGASIGSVSFAHPVVTLPEGEELGEIEKNTFMMSNASILNDNRRAQHYL
uniref:Vesicular glutamate transporter (inferred by orthology to a D. melanogaster protein) n=1 Tax=Strongyloides venezuelensis TaxID=75913 RepID=A0A0K0F7P0_STRVS